MSKLASTLHSLKTPLLQFRLRFATTPSKQAVQTLKKIPQQKKRLAASELPFLPGLVVHDYEETITKVCEYCEKKLSQNTSITQTKQQNNCRAICCPATAPCVWLHLGKGVGEKKRIYLAVIHRRTALLHKARINFYHFPFLF